MKKIYTFLIALFFVGGAMGQTDGPCELCLPDGIEFTTQAQIDSFQINYPGCTEIEGYVVINGNDITNLNGLNVVTSIGGDFLIGNYQDGANPLLSNLQGLEALTSIGASFAIQENNALTSLAGLDNVTSIWGTFAIEGNDALTSLMGLEGLTYIGNLYINVNPVLTNLTGLEGLTSIGRDLWISDNDILTSLTGLDSMTFIGEDLGITENPSLTNLTGLDNLDSIGGRLVIIGNDALSSLTEIENVDANTISDLFIRLNPSLSSCAVQSICDFLLAPSGTVEIHDNAVGCNSPEEVLDSCKAHTGIIDGFSLVNGLLIYPNPAQSIVTIELPSSPTKNTTLSISNHNGQQLITQAITKPQTEIDISHLPVGIYIVKVWNDKDVMVRKVIRR